MIAAPLAMPAATPATGAARWWEDGTIAVIARRLRAAADDRLLVVAAEPLAVALAVAGPCRHVSARQPASPEDGDATAVVALGLCALRPDAVERLAARCAPGARLILAEHVDDADAARILGAVADAGLALLATERCGDALVVAAIRPVPAAWL